MWLIDGAQELSLESAVRSLCCKCSTTTEPWVRSAVQKSSPLKRLTTCAATRACRLSFRISAGVEISIHVVVRPHHSIIAFINVHAQGGKTLKPRALRVRERETCSWAVLMGCCWGHLVHRWRTARHR